jgi:hypothetical protein
MRERKNSQLLAMCERDIVTLTVRAWEYIITVTNAFEVVKFYRGDLGHDLFFLHEHIACSIDERRKSEDEDAPFIFSIYYSTRDTGTWIATNTMKAFETPPWRIDPSHEEYVFTFEMTKEGRFYGSHFRPEYP